MASTRARTRKPLRPKPHCSVRHARGKNRHDPRSHLRPGRAGGALRRDDRSPRERHTEAVARRGAGGSGHMDVTALISIVLALLGAAILAPVINELDARWRSSYKEGLNDER